MIDLINPKWYRITALQGWPRRIARGYYPADFIARWKTVASR